MGIGLVEKVYVEGDFTPLSEHNSQTPTTFFATVPILHLHSRQATIRVSQDVLTKVPNLARLQTGVLESGTSTAVERSIENIDIWVTSKYLALSSDSAGLSVRVDYPTIAVHGQQDDAVMLVLTTLDDELSNEDSECVQMHIIPRQGAEPSAKGTNETNGHVAPSTAAQDLFKAIGDCQELNPDPANRHDGDDEDDDAIIQPEAGGWITSENMHEFVDEDGSFRMPEVVQPLGQGAGSTRTAEDATLDEAEDDDSKWQRTG